MKVSECCLDQIMLMGRYCCSILFVCIKSFNLPKGPGTIPLHKVTVQNVWKKMYYNIRLKKDINHYESYIWMSIVKFVCRNNFVWNAFHFIFHFLMTPFNDNNCYYHSFFSSTKLYNIDFQIIYLHNCFI